MLDFTKEVLFALGVVTSIGVVVKEYKNKVVTLFTSPPYQISTEGKYPIIAGCHKAFLTCKNKFNNIVNFPCQTIYTSCLAA